MAPVFNYAFPSGTNVFVPGFSGSDTSRLIVDYSRNPKDFPVNFLATIHSVDVPQGYFAKLDPLAQARLTSSPQHYSFADGSQRPIQVDNVQSFSFISYFAQRYCRTQPIGYLALQNAAWDLDASTINVLANQMMTVRTNAFYGEVTNSANYLSTHTNNATSLGGGFWSAGTTTNRYIQKTLMAAAQQIVLDTAQVVGIKDLTLVVGPTVATAMAASGEIADMVSHAYQDARQFLEFKAWSEQTALWGLPPMLYGIKVVVDESVENAVQIGATNNPTFLAGSDAAYLMTKRDALNSVAGSGSFSSFGFFIPKGQEMVVERFDDPLNCRVIHSLSDYWQIQMVAPESAYLITNTLS
jgi:hypothetical protein